MSCDVTFNVEEACKAQEKYCKDHGYPHFAPWRGICYSCHNQIYSGPQGYSVEYAGHHLITGCPICMASYVD